jgi:hypothetical protein
VIMRCTADTVQCPRDSSADRTAPAASQAISQTRSKEGDKKRAELTEQVTPLLGTHEATHNYTRSPAKVE